MMKAVRELRESIKLPVYENQPELIPKDDSTAEAIYQQTYEALLQAVEEQRKLSEHQAQDEQNRLNQAMQFQAAMNALMRIILNNIEPLGNDAIAKLRVLRDDATMPEAKRTKEMALITESLNQLSHVLFDCHVILKPEDHTPEQITKSRDRLAILSQRVQGHKSVLWQKLGQLTVLFAVLSAIGAFAMTPIGGPCLFAILVGLCAKSAGLALAAAFASMPLWSTVLGLGAGYGVGGLAQGLYGFYTYKKASVATDLAKSVENVSTQTAALPNATGPDAEEENSRLDASA